ncbi:hypothetical protein ABDJ85_02200 [Roseateles sp. DJS-2-20]|jgi:polar amino acid transport system substrate-binding protein|uniref:Solute-binding protein family 3/N-terminal domain-containing protein n=1 Tax=Roseateles paludis TaxID=3145238 RepID=A0ABV0FWF7_9BURK
MALTRAWLVLGRVCLLGLALLADLAGAACSRPISVPMAPTGLSVYFQGDQALGIYPSLLRDLSARLPCDFRMRQVPRARQQMLFESGQLDLFIPASEVPARAEFGEFIPLVQARIALVTLGEGRALPGSVPELLAAADLRVAVVRSYSYGPAYEALITTLRERRRLVEEADPASVARALQMGLAQVSLIHPLTLMGVMVTEPALAPLLRDVHTSNLPEFGWTTSGAYLSTRSLGEADRRLLKQALVEAARNQAVWRLVTQIAAVSPQHSGMRPLPANLLP